MLKAFKRKISSCVGESLVEALVALLVSAMALLMLAVAIGAGANIVGVSRTQQQNYNDANTALARVDSSKSDTVSITTKYDGAKISTEAIDVYYVIEPLPGGDDGVSYRAKD